jgi:8-oxo-dGTP diphosphatase
MVVQKTVHQPLVGVGVIVFRFHNNKEQVLMHRRKVVSFGKHSWGTGGGHLELGESLKEGALRELREEAGDELQVENVQFLGVCNILDFSPKHYVDISFRADWISGEAQTAVGDEAVEWQWFDLDSLPSPLFPVVARYLEAYKTGEVCLDT